MVVVKIGGPAYRIGMGGGAASSVPSGGREGGNAADLDFNAVQVTRAANTCRACKHANLGPVCLQRQLEYEVVDGSQRASML